MKTATSKPPAKKSPERRSDWLSQWLVGAGVVLIVAVVAIFGIRWYLNRTPSLNGALLTPPVPAPNFRLEDQFGQPVALSDFRGKVVVLTFLYTNCPDACPIITEKLHQAYTQLGPDTAHLAILAVTVDPVRDTVAQVRTYSVEKDMLQKWHFLVGAANQLSPIWNLYGVAAAPDTTGMDATPTGASSQGGLVPTVTSSAVIDHSAPVFVIDPSGRERTILDVNFNPQDLVDDVHALLAGA